MSTPGMFVSIIPKDGGNQVHGSIFGEYTRAGWNGDNVDSTLKKAGLQPPKTLERYMFNPSIGGPIVKDKLWYQGSFLVLQNTNQVLNSYANASTNPLLFKADLSHPVNDPTRNYAGTGRITWQDSLGFRSSPPRGHARVRGTATSWKHLSLSLWWRAVSASSRPKGRDIWNMRQAFRVRGTPAPASGRAPHRDPFPR